MSVGVQTHYRVPINDQSFPPWQALDARRGRDYLFETLNKREAWSLHPSRRFVGVPDGKVELIAKEFTDEEIRAIGGLRSENIIAWGLRNGLLPSVEQEVHALLINEAGRTIQKECWIAGLGSYVMVDDIRYVAVMVIDASGQTIDGKEYFGGWPRQCRFLFTRILKHA